MSVQFISTNKNYKRLYASPLDPSASWNTEEEMLNYLTDPTCYANQIMGCNGKAYIVVEVDGIKRVREIGYSKDNDSNESGSGVEVDNRFFIGEEEPVEPPEELLVWIDTSNNDDAYTGGLEDVVIEEFRGMFDYLKEKITTLEKKNLDLEARVMHLEGKVVEANN